MDVNQKLKSDATYVRALKTAYQMNRVCPECNSHRSQLNRFLDDAEGAQTKRDEQNANWYMEVAAQMAQSHLVADHNLTATSGTSVSH